MAYTPTTAPPVQQSPSKTVWVSSGLYSSDQTISGSLLQLSRVHDASWSATYPLVDSAYVDGNIESFYPTSNGIDLSLQWLPVNLHNEAALGLIKVNNSVNYCIDTTTDLLLGLDEEKNAYIAIEDAPGVDFVGAPASDSRTVLGLGQGCLTQYQLSAAVGSFIEASANLNYLTAVVYTGSSGLAIPAVSYQSGTQLTGQFVIPVGSAQYNRFSSSPYDNVSALGPQDISMAFGDNNPFAVVYSGAQSCYLRSFTLNLAIDRREQKPLGYAYPMARAVMYPIRVEITTEAVVSKYQADQLRRVLS